MITYGEMLTFYAEVRGLRRWLVPVSRSGGIDSFPHPQLPLSTFITMSVMKVDSGEAMSADPREFPALLNGGNMVETR